MTAKLKALSKAKKVLLGVGAFVVLAGIIGALSPPKEQSIELTGSNKSPAQTEPTAKKPEIVTKVSDEITAMPFQRVTRNDSSLEVGVSAVTTAGVDGKKITTFEVIYTEGVETSRKPIGERIDPQPVNEVTSIGTKPKPVPKPTRSASCDSNYSGCVPIASDVDCAGGSGNGPAYANGPVQVIGVDVYDLDRDGNGIACE